MNGINPRITELEAENALLRQKLADFEMACGLRWHAPRRLPLPPREESILGVLLGRDNVIAAEHLFQLVYMADLYAFDDIADACVIQSHISKLRKKLKALGADIRCTRHLGYWMEPEAKQRVLDLFTAEESICAIASTVEIPKWVPDDLRVEYDRHARRFGEFYAARVIRRQIHSTSGHTARA